MAANTNAKMTPQTMVPVMLSKGFIESLLVYSID